jgi:hypothetical protein
MQGKNVKVNNSNIITYMFPNYITLSYVTFLNRDDNVIYVGKPFKGFEEYLKKNTRNYISLVGNPDLDLSTNKALIEYCYEHKGKKLNNSTLYFLESLNDRDLWSTLKIFLQVGKLPYDIKKSISMYHLFQSFSEPTPATLKILFELMETYPLSILEASLLTFLDRVVHNMNESVSNKYGLLINNTRNKFGKNIRKSLLTYCKSPKHEVDFINLVLSIRGV